MSDHCTNPKHFIRRIGAGEERLLDQLALRFTRKIQGSLKQGTRPYAEFMGARYKNDILVDTPELIHQEVTLVVKPKKDIRQLKAYLPSGAELGFLSVTGPWRRSAHTLKMRKEAMKLINLKHIKRDGRTDPIQAMKEFYAKQATRNRKAAAKYAKIDEVQKATSMKTSAPQKNTGRPVNQPAQPKSPSGKNIPSRAGFME